MRTISVAILAGILGLAEPFAAQAAGLGRLTVLSPLGSPLNTEIEIVSLQSGEEDGLSARLASAAGRRNHPTRMMKSLARRCWVATG